MSNKNYSVLGSNYNNNEIGCTIGINKAPKSGVPELFQHFFNDFFDSGFSNSMLRERDFFDRLVSIPLVNRFERTSNFPPYNILEDENKNTILEFALAGYKKEQLEITLENDVLTVSGKSFDQTENKKVLHKGMAQRSFVCAFTIAENKQLFEDSVKFVDGVLTITIFDVTPPEKQKRILEIK